jgi:hypothetical protein
LETMEADNEVNASRTTSRERGKAAMWLFPALHWSIRQRYLQYLGVEECLNRQNRSVI